MNLTNFKCALKILGWKLIVAQRQSKWADEHGSSIVFMDDEFKLRLHGYPTETLSYFQDLEPVLEVIIKHAEYRDDEHGQKPVPSDYNPNGLASKKPA